MIPHFDAIRFEGVMPQGRTQPLILGCRQQNSDLPSESKLVKILGGPGRLLTHQIISEVLGNAIARQMGIPTPEPCIVHISEQAANMFNRNLTDDAYSFVVRSGIAAGCDLLRPSPAPFIAGQNLTQENQLLAALIYVFDFLTENPDRRLENPNCGLQDSKLMAFDFEMCFSSLFLPIIGRTRTKPWDIEFMAPGNHLFFPAMRDHPPATSLVQEVVQKLTLEWWQEQFKELPDTWKPDAEKIGIAVQGVVSRSEEFANDVGRSLLWT